MRMLGDITEQYDMNGYRSIIGTASMKFKPLLPSGCINIIMNVQIWHWAVLPELCSKRTKLFITSLPKLLQFSIGVLLWRNRMLSQA